MLHKFPVLDGKYQQLVYENNLCMLAFFSIYAPVLKCTHHLNVDIALKLHMVL